MEELFENPELLVEKAMTTAVACVVIGLFKLLFCTAGGLMLIAFVGVVIAFLATYGESIGAGVVSALETAQFLHAEGSSALVFLRDFAIPDAMNALPVLVLCLSPFLVCLMLVGLNKVLVLVVPRYRGWPVKMHAQPEFCLRTLM